jgi:peptide chain release factor 2
MSQPGFWDDQESAKKVIARLKICTAATDEWERLSSNVDDTIELMTMSADDGEPMEAFAPEIDRLQTEFDKYEHECLLSGEYDQYDCYVKINAGAGGVDACDWASILLRMYAMWAKHSGYKTEEIDFQEETEGGITSATLLVRGDNTFGMLRSEHGVHRLVRISPFNAAGKRQTSFASVEITPFFEDEGALVIDEDDLHIDYYRAGGKGGQHVNTTDSAVRIKHIPSGFVVQCQNERSQHKNKATAMSYLRAKLVQLEIERRAAQNAAITGAKADIGWGSQIRSYVIHPYRMVKDHRSLHQSSDVDAVMRGEILPFQEAFLRWVLAGRPRRKDIVAENDD